MAESQILKFTPNDGQFSQTHGDSVLCGPSIGNALSEACPEYNRRIEESLLRYQTEERDANGQGTAARGHNKAHHANQYNKQASHHGIQRAKRAVWNSSLHGVLSQVLICYKQSKIFQLLLAELYFQILVNLSVIKVIPYDDAGELAILIYWLNSLMSQSISDFLQ